MSTNKNEIDAKLRDKEKLTNAEIAMLEQEFKELSGRLLRTETELQLRTEGTKSMSTEATKREIEQLNKEIVVVTSRINNIIGDDNFKATPEVENETKEKDKVPVDLEGILEEKKQQSTKYRRFPVVFSYEDFKGDDGDY